MPKLETLTELVNESLFAPNNAHYINPQNDIIPNYHSNDTYIYDIKKLNSKETRYCNALFLDRINTTLGFSSLNKIVGSLIYYKTYLPRVDYSNLYKIIYNYFNNIET